MTSMPIRGIGRRQLAVLMAALLAFAGFAMWRTSQSASAAAATVQQNLTCGLAGDLAVTYTVESTPAVPEAGKAFTLTTSSSMSPPA